MDEKPKKRRRRWRQSQISAVLTLCELMTDKQVALKLRHATGGERYTQFQIKWIRKCHGRHKLTGPAGLSFAKQKRTRDSTGKDLRAELRARTRGYYQSRKEKVEIWCPTCAKAVTVPKNRFRSLCLGCHEFIWFTTRRSRRVPRPTEIHCLNCGVTSTVKISPDSKQATCPSCRRRVFVKHGDEKPDTGGPLM